MTKRRLLALESLDMRDIEGDLVAFLFIFDLVLFRV
jgi:hypothetical protein